MSDEEYRAHPAIAQSDIKVLLEGGPVEYQYQKERNTGYSEALRKGGMVDSFLLTPEEFLKGWELAKGEFQAPSTTHQRSLVDAYLQSQDPLTAIRRSNYKTTGDDEKDLTSALEKLAPFMPLIDSKISEKNFYSEEDKQMLTAVYHSIRYNEEASNIIWPTSKKERSLIAKLRQLKLTGRSYNHIPMKGMIDVVNIYRSKDTLYVTLCDLKTTSRSLGSFRSSVVKWGYDFQLTWYYLLLKSYLENKYNKSFKIVMERTCIVATKVKPPYETRVFDFEGDVIKANIEVINNVLENFLLYSREGFDLFRSSDNPPGVEKITIDELVKLRLNI